MPIDDYGIDFDGDGGPGRTRLLPCPHVRIVDVLATPTVCADCGYVFTVEELGRDAEDLRRWEEARDERAFEEVCF